MFGTHGIPARSLEMARAWDPGAGEDGADRYTRFFADIIALHREHGAVLAAFREVAVHDATARGFYTADLEGFDEAVLQTLLDRQRAGSTPSDVDAVAAGRVICSSPARPIRSSPARL
jgi:hypothetical protein